MKDARTAGKLIGAGLIAEALAIVYALRADGLDGSIAVTAIVVPIVLVSLGVLRALRRPASANRSVGRFAAPAFILSLIVVSSAAPLSVAYRLLGPAHRSGDQDAASEPVAEEVFQTTRAAGAAAALAVLRQRTAADSSLLPRSHHIAHQTGRLAIERAQFDISSLSECTLEFASGCVHGMLERYFYARPLPAEDSMASFCRDLTTEPRVGSRTLECSHGLGHGLAVGSNHDVRPALTGCDHLGSAIERRECADGVFMEVTARALGGGHPGATNHEHGSTHQSHGTMPRMDGAIATSSRPRLPSCADVSGEYRASCWAYRYLIIHANTDGSWEDTVEGCRAAESTELVSACLFGVGKQLASNHFGDWEPVHRFCASLPSDEAAACIAGGVEHVLDYDWTSARAEAFCASAPRELTEACFQRLGARLGLLHIGGAAREACDAMTGDGAAACRRGLAAMRQAQSASAGA